MSHCNAAWLAWSLFALTAVLILAMTLLSVGHEPTFDTLPYGLLSISLATVGALIASRHPRNLIGWIFSLALYGETGDGSQKAN